MECHCHWGTCEKPAENQKCDDDFGGYYHHAGNVHDVETEDECAQNCRDTWGHELEGDGDGKANGCTTMHHWFDKKGTMKIAGIGKSADGTCNKKRDLEEVPSE